MHDSYDDDLDDDEFDDEDDSSDDLLDCPHCGAAIYDDSVSCPVCGEYVTFGTHAFSGKPWWWLALGVLGVLALLASLLLF